MSDVESTDAAETVSSESATEEASELKPTEAVEFWKQKAREQEKRAKENAEAFKRATELESEVEKARGEAAEAVKQVAEVEARATRLQVALDKGLPVDLVDRLRGDDAESLAADADALMALFKKGEVDRTDRGAYVPAEGHAPAHALNGDGLEDALRSKLGI